MTTETEMRILLDDLLNQWQKYPNYRFGQLIVNILGIDPFYVSNMEAMKKINNYNATIVNVECESCDTST